MLDKLNNFYSYIMTNIQILVISYYIFCMWLKISNYITDLLYKD